MRDRDRAAGGASRIAVVDGFVNTVAYDIDVCAEVERKVADRAPERICRNAAESKRAMSGGTVTVSCLCSGDGSRDIERAIVDRGVVHRAEQAADKDAVVFCAVDHFLRFGDVHIEVLHRRAASGVGERTRQRQIADLFEIGRVRSNAGMSERVCAAALSRVSCVPLVIDLERDVGAAAVQRRLKDAVQSHICAVIRGGVLTERISDRAAGIGIGLHRAFRAAVFSVVVEEFLKRRLIGDRGVTLVVNQRLIVGVGVLPIAQVIDPIAHGDAPYRSVERGRAVRRRERRLRLRQRKRYAGAQQCDEQDSEQCDADAFCCFFHISLHRLKARISLSPRRGLFCAAAPYCVR